DPTARILTAVTGDPAGAAQATFNWTVTPPTGATAPDIEPMDDAGDQVYVQFHAAGSYTFSVSATDDAGTGTAFVKTFSVDAVPTRIYGDPTALSVGT